MQHNDPKCNFIRIAFNDRSGGAYQCHGVFDLDRFSRLWYDALQILILMQHKISQERCQTVSSTNTPRSSSSSSTSSSSISSMIALFIASFARRYIEKNQHKLSFLRKRPWGHISTRWSVELVARCWPPRRACQRCARRRRWCRRGGRAGARTRGWGCWRSEGRLQPSAFSPWWFNFTFSRTAGESKTWGRNKEEAISTQQTAAAESKTCRHSHCSSENWQPDSSTDH